jgi:hypothetical protein
MRANDDRFNRLAHVVRFVRLHDDIGAHGLIRSNSLTFCLVNDASPVPKRLQLNITMSPPQLLRL